MTDSYTNVFENHDFIFQLCNQHMPLNGSWSTQAGVYMTNNLNFRDLVDIIPGDPADILALGCSHTYGLGVPQEYTWSSMLEKKSNMRVANLGICGASAQQIINFAMYYINNIGKPKQIFAVFPNTQRHYNVIDGIFFKNKRIQKEKAFLTTSFIETMNWYSGEIYKKEKIVKLPTYPEIVIPPQEPIKIFIESIYTMQTISSLAGIDFYWGTWDDLFVKYLKDSFFNDERFCLNKNIFIDLDNEKTVNDCKKCDSSLMEEKHLNVWDLGSDKRHFGIHWHKHVAEHFMNKIPS